MFFFWKFSIFSRSQPRSESADGARVSLLLTCPQPPASARSGRAGRLTGAQASNPKRTSPNPTKLHRFRNPKILKTQRFKKKEDNDVEDKMGGGRGGRSPSPHAGTQPKSYLGVNVSLLFLYFKAQMSNEIFLFI